MPNFFTEVERKFTDRASRKAIDDDWAQGDAECGSLEKV